MRVHERSDIMQSTGLNKAYKAPVLTELAFYCKRLIICDINK